MLRAFLLLSAISFTAFAADFDAEVNALKQDRSFRWDKTTGMDVSLYVADGSYVIVNSGNKAYTIDSAAYIRTGDGKNAIVNIGGTTIEPKTIRRVSKSSIKKEHTSSNFDAK